MKKLVFIIVTALMITFHVSSLGETLTLYGGTFPESNTGYQEFHKMHPDIKLDYPDISYHPASAFITALLTDEFRCDLFFQRTNQADWDTLMAKGYCCDLSGNTVIADAVNRMHPGIAAQAMYDGHIYAIPKSINFRYYKINRETWLQAGYTLEDVPKTFPQLLDFLSAWCDRIETEPEDRTVAFGGWDSATYNSSAQTTLLAEMLINQITIQQQFSGSPLIFNSEESISLLERCSEIGARLYELETQSYNSTLFEYIGFGLWPESVDDMVFLSLHESDPRIIVADLSMWAVMSKSIHIETSIELLEKAAIGLTNPIYDDDLLLYMDSEPRINPNYESGLNYWIQQRDEATEKLGNEDLDPDVRVFLEEKLETYKRNIIQAEESKWKIPPNVLEKYKEMAKNLFFPPANVFDQAAEGYDQLWRLINKFGSNGMSAREMLNELDSIANMMRIENEM